jgi:hypothetical protein
MSDEQFDLFDDVQARAAPVQTRPAERPTIDPTSLDDEELVGDLGDAPMADCVGRVREIGRRRLGAGIPALEALCRRHAGFGRAHIVPEQAAAIDAMIAIGGDDAAAAIGRLVGRGLVEGPGLSLVLAAAARLRAPLPEAVVGHHLRDDDPEIRAAAARCVEGWPRLAPALIELLDDLHGRVQVAAACALGRMRRGEGRSVLLRALQEDPTTEVIDASASVADEEIIVLLGRVAKSRPNLIGVVQDALESIDHPTATRVLLRLPRVE